MKGGMTPASVLRATVDDIVLNPGAAFRISMPFLLAIALVFLAVTLTLAASGDPAATFPFAQFLPLFSLVMIVIGFNWTAVCWHRHVILGEPPGVLMPRWPSGSLLGYFGRSILVALVVMVILIVPLLIASVIAPTSYSLDGSQSYRLGGLPSDLSPLSIAVWVVLSALAWGVSLRAGLILPASAIGEPKTLGDVWNKTNGRFLTFFAPLGLVLALVFAVLDVTTSYFAFGGVSQLLSMWLQVMIGIGILTREYTGFFGHSAHSS